MTINTIVVIASVFGLVEFGQSNESVAYLSGQWLRLRRGATEQLAGVIDQPVIVSIKNKPGIV